MNVGLWSSLTSQYKTGIISFLFFPILATAALLDDLFSHKHKRVLMNRAELMQVITDKKNRG